MLYNISVRIQCRPTIGSTESSVNFWFLVTSLQTQCVWNINKLSVRMKFRQIIESKSNRSNYRVYWNYVMWSIWSCIWPKICVTGIPTNYWFDCSGDHLSVWVKFDKASILSEVSTNHLFWVKFRQIYVRVKFWTFNEFE